MDIILNKEHHLNFKKNDITLKKIIRNVFWVAKKCMKSAATDEESEFTVRF